VDLLVAVEVYELQVGVLICSALAFGVQVMLVEGFSVEEGSSAVSAPSPLGVCQADEPGRQLADLSLFASDPVTSKGGIVRGGRTLYEHVPLYGCPGELQEVGSCALVPENPPVGALGV
jgi:hypothetical protein